MSGISGSKIPAAFSMRRDFVSIDIEVGITDNRIHKFAAVKADSGDTFKYQSNQGEITKALQKLDVFSMGCRFVLGHNIVEFDIPHLRSTNPSLNLLESEVIDTLRLNPLAFPRNPYHRLVKHYKDGQLVRGQINDPELDARLTIRVFDEQIAELKNLQSSNPDLLKAWHWLICSEAAIELDDIFKHLRDCPRPSEAEAADVILQLLAEQGCQNYGRSLILAPKSQRWELAYALAWLSVSGSNSVVPPWVRHQFPGTCEIISNLRNRSCGLQDCPWCSERHNAQKELKKWFGFDDFRPEPKDESGKPLQRVIVESAMQNQHVLGILPTGTGKSLCYQIPALSRYDKTGSLTVVVSPLVALMEDQVLGLKNRQIDCCAAINGMLSMPERADVLDKIRLGDVGILIISPEQLRNNTVRKVLEQREIGSWVLDEAHCLSKWGQDFRPDYRYVGRFIKERSGKGSIPPILCLTATAKPEVVQDIVSYFNTKVGVQLEVFNGGAARDNLTSYVAPTTAFEKFAHVEQLLTMELTHEGEGGAIVYCSSRKATEEISAFLNDKGWSADCFHAGLKPDQKKTTQERFINGEIRVIAATNAFGMGIDKPDVRLVVHADIPGSLENYLQEAGRAGRDRMPAKCVLLFNQDDVEKQFQMSARSKLKQDEIQAILRSIRKLDKRKGKKGEIVATSGEILSLDEEGGFGRDSATDDTRVRTAISWLEEAHHITREQNEVQVFPSSLRVNSIEEAKVRIQKSNLFEGVKEKLLVVVKCIIASDPTQGVSTDEIMNISGMTSEEIRTALYDLERIGIASNDTALTAFVHAKVERSSESRLHEVVEIEKNLIAVLREEAPDLSKNESSSLYLRQTSQKLKDLDLKKATPERISRILYGLSKDGRTESNETGSILLRKLGQEALNVTLLREWNSLETTAAIRIAACQCVLSHLLSCIPPNARGLDILSVTTMGDLSHALEADLTLKGRIKDQSRLLYTALLWLHEQDIIKLNKGLAIFRPAMTIRVQKGAARFTKADYLPLKLHYREQTIQVHIMAEYAQRGLDNMENALELTFDYFNLKQDDFLQKWLPKRQSEIALETTFESWRRIVESIQNSSQKEIVTDDRDSTNVLVLAGPGAGKTKIIVHRIAYLIRVRRERADSILALAYNRHAAIEIRTRLKNLIGSEAFGVTVLTCHSLAMRLSGVSFHQLVEVQKEDIFKKILRDAIDLLNGDGLAPDEADEQRERLLAGFRWIFVDEYQDIGPEQYELVSALAGRRISEDQKKLTIMCVGDDDQNIYTFDGASVEYLRRFEQDYNAKKSYLVENYRSTKNIIDASNQIISLAQNRMKADKPIVINKNRAEELPGGVWETKDVVARGRVSFLQPLSSIHHQAIGVMNELIRLSKVDPNWSWANCAVIAREWKYLEPIRAYCESLNIPVEMANDQSWSFWRLRETQRLVDWVKDRREGIISPIAIAGWISDQGDNAFWLLLAEALKGFILSNSEKEVPIAYFLDWLAEWGRELRRAQTGLMLLTAHRAKGLEFKHVAILDGNWDKVGPNEDVDAPRRLYYVAMTRAMETLTLSRLNGGSNLIGPLYGNQFAYLAPEHSLSVPPEVYRRYICPPLNQVDIGFAGRFSVNHAVHKNIANIDVDALVSLELQDGSWYLLDEAGTRVGKMAKVFKPPNGKRFVQGKVLAIYVRRKEDADEKYAIYTKSDRWEVLVPELVFE